MADLTDDMVRHRVLIEQGEKRIAAGVKAFKKLLQSPKDAPQEDIDALYVKLVGTVEHVDLAITKWLLVRDMNSAELALYGQSQQSIEHRIKETEREVVLRRAELERERGIRANRQQYDAMARALAIHPSRSETSRKISEVEAELEKLAASKSDLDAQIELRRKQFAAFVHSIRDLQAAIAGEKAAAAVTVAETPAEEEQEPGVVLDDTQFVADDAGGSMVVDSESVVADATTTAHTPAPDGNARTDGGEEVEEGAVQMETD